MFAAFSESIRGVYYGFGIFYCLLTETTLSFPFVLVVSRWPQSYDLYSISSLLIKVCEDLIVIVVFETLAIIPLCWDLLELILVLVFCSWVIFYPLVLVFAYSSIILFVCNRAWGDSYLELHFIPWVKHDPFVTFYSFI